ncbi:MAG: ATP-binding protein, partial [Acidobacteriota bacterium]
DADAPGAGLGLAMVREIAELHGGRVMLESEPGSGSTFTLRLPIESPLNK